MSGPYVYAPDARASRRLGLLILLGLGLCLTVALYYVKTRAQAARDHVARLDAQIIVEREAIAVLRAERAVLSAPARLRAISDEKLALTPITTETTQSMDAVIRASGEEEAGQ